MKSFSKILLTSVVLFNTATVLAQKPISIQSIRCKIQDKGYSSQEVESHVINQDEYNYLNNQFPSFHLLSSSSYLDITPKLMMNPSSIEKGTKSLGIFSGIWSRRATTTEKIIEDSQGKEENKLPTTSVQCIAKDTNEEVEIAFARARTTKSEYAWKEAETLARATSAYWERKIENTKTQKDPSFDQEEAIKQKVHFTQKANLAEVQTLVTRPFEDNSVDQLERADEIMEHVIKKSWPTVSTAMKTFIDHPNMDHMFAVREAVSASATASACAYLHASFYAYDSCSPYTYMYASSYISASSSAFASAYAADGTSAAKVAEASTEALNTAIDWANKYGVYDATQENNYSEENIDWALATSVRAMREATEFAHAMAIFKAEQETLEGKPMTEWGIPAHIAEIKTLIASTTHDEWKAKRECANAIIALLRNKVWPQVSQTVQAFIDDPNETQIIAGCKAFLVSAATSHAYALAYATTSNAAYASTSASVFPAAFTYTVASASASASASAHAYASALTSVSAVEAAEIADAIDNLAKASTLATTAVKKFSLNTTAQENIDWSVDTALKAAEFARAVASFKAGQKTLIRK